MNTLIWVKSDGRHEITKVLGSLGLRFAVTPCVDSHVQMNVTTTHLQ